jgi:hypothetical protein
MIGSYSESSYIRTVFISKHVTDHKFLEDVHEDSLQIPRQKNQFLCNRPNKPLKVSGRRQCLADWVEDIQTSEQHRPDARSSFSNFYTELDFKNWHYLEGSASRPDEVATCPNASQHFRIFQCSVRTRKGVIVKTVQTLRQAIRTYTCYGKNCAFLEGGRRRPSWRGNLLSGCSTAKVWICPDLKFL